ncbi:sodium-independent sulfate anion transporter-like protein [Leptotrombidium deliense]|uniref:Sodium-independent sulfate anion transporter-like protein n=1 Tax=Leptotrombidium deliense TaxID=299467 RepID=A0A443SAW8_9ACAR|nr:sodium-independent sulfate anion transporter-like protein [Leptotrombidium deliense]
MLNSLKRRFPISQWLPGYEWNEFKCDLLAGLTLACTLIPQALGFALLANVPITYGLYSSIFTTFVYTLFGSSKDTTIGPTAVQSMFTGYYVSIGNLNYAALLSFISGILQIIFGLLRLDFIVDLIPFPVISAFTNATVITIAVSQLPGFFGVPKRDKIPLRSFDASQEILTLGIANFLGSFFHAFPGAVSFNRAMILHTSGVKTQMCNVITGIVVLLSMLPIISPAFHYIPITTLSAVVICAVVLLGKPQDFVFMYRTNIVDFVLYMVTFLLTLLAGLVPGILTGIALFILNLLAKIIRPQIECQLKQVTYEENNNHSCYPYLHVRPTQSIHFPSIDYLVSKTIESLPNISTAKSCDTKFVVVIDGKHMFHTDSTFLKGIKDFAVCVQRRGIQIIFHNFQTAIVQKLHSMFKDNKIAFNESQENDDLIKAIQTAYSGTFKV